MDETVPMMAQEPKEVKMNMMEKDEDQEEEEMDCKCCPCKCCQCSRAPIKFCCCDVTSYCLLCTFIPVGILLLLLILILI